MVRRKENIIRTKKVEWALFVVLFSIIPYGIRFLYYLTWSEDVPDFYISELDIFLFCISITVALFAELKYLKTLPYELGTAVCYGILMVYILILFGGVCLSLDFEHRILVLKTSCSLPLQSDKNISDMTLIITHLEKKKFNLFLASVLLGLFTPIVSYRTIFKRNG